MLGITPSHKHWERAITHVTLETWMWLLLNLLIYYSYNLTQRGQYACDDNMVQHMYYYSYASNIYIYIWWRKILYGVYIRCRLSMYIDGPMRLIGFPYRPWARGVHHAPPPPPTSLQNYVFLNPQSVHNKKWDVNSKNIGTHYWFTALF